MRLAYLATCFCADTSPIWMLRDSARSHGIDLRLYGVGEPFLPGFIEIKVDALLPELDALESEGFSHVMYNDGPDTFFVRGAEEIESEYRRMGSPSWLLSRETSCYPHTALGPELPRDKRCPNTGQYMGEIGAIRAGWEKLRALYHNGTDNEQGWVIRGIVDEALPELTLDMDRRIFRSEADDWAPGTSGCVLHFNGGYWDPETGKRDRMLPVWEAVHA